MSTPFTPAFRPSLVAAVVASALIGACSSSGGDDPAPANDAPGGEVVVPDTNVPAVPGGGAPTDGPGETPVEGPTDGPGETPVEGPTDGPGEMPVEGPTDGPGETPVEGPTDEPGETPVEGPTDGPGETPVTGTDTPPTAGPTLVTGGVFGPVAGRTTSVGSVQIDQPGDGSEGAVSAGFFRTELPIPVGQAISSFVPPLDTCTVTRTGPDDVDAPGDDGFGDFDFPFEFLSAGETITFTSPAGTWLTLPRQDAFGFVLYGTEDGLPQPIPSGLVVDIPGDGFPAFANVPVADVAPLAGTMPSGTPATADTTFRWQAGGGDPSVYVQISIFSGGVGGLLDGLPQDFIDALPEGGIPGLESGPSVSLDCIVRDDGEFSLPAATRAELGTDFSGVPDYSRLGTTVVQSGDALLLVFNESSSD